MPNERTTSTIQRVVDLSVLCRQLPSCSVLIELTTTHYTIMAASPAFCKWIGVADYENLVGKNYFELTYFQYTTPDVLNKIRTSFDNVILYKEKNQLTPGRFQFKHVKGLSTKNFSITNQPVLSDTGDVLYILQTLEELLLPEEDSSNNEQLLRQLTETVPAILWMTAPDGQCTYLNKSWYVMTGQVPEEALGYGWLDATHPDDQEEASRLFVGANKKHLPFTLHYRLRQHDGTYRWSIDKGKPRFDSAGNYLGMIGTVLDIHDQKLAEEQTQNLSVILEASQEFVGIANLDATIQYINPAGLHMLGWEDFKGKSILDSIHPEDKALAQSLLPLLFTQGRFSHEIRLNPAQPGKPVWLQWNAIAIRDKKSGEVTNLATISANITERKITEQALRQSEERVRSFVESAPFPIGVYVGREMRIELANQAIMDAWGKGNDVIGKLYTEILPELGNQQIFEQLDQVYTSGQPFHAKYQQVDLVTNGELRPFFFNYSFTPLFDGNGKVYGVMNTAAEVTDLMMARKKLEESEAQFRHLVMQAPVAIAVFKGEDFVVEIANDSYLPLVDKTREEFVGRPLFDALPETRETLEPIARELMRTGQSFPATEFEIGIQRHGKLETCYFNSVWEPLRDVHGTVNGFIVVAHEVTAQVMARRQIEDVVTQRTKELAQANEALLRSNQELERSNANLEEFAHAASHDMKEPIRKVLTFADRLKNSLETRITDAEKHLFERMENAAQRMGTLVDDLLEFSHVSERPHEMELVDLNVKLRRVLTDLELPIEEKKAAIHIAPLPIVKGYKRQLQQLFQNLVGNALKYSKADIAPEITISSSTISGREAPIALLSELAEQPFYWIRLTDNGIGFEQEYAERIFGMFQRLHGKAEYAGTGVGLSIARKVVENHHGYIWAESQVGKGATFHVLLPA